jgi:hypothetical protein
MFKSRDKQRSTISSSSEEKHDDRDGRDSKQSGPRNLDADAAERLAGKLDPDPVAQFGWFSWMLALLVILCLVLAAWVWLEILHIR